jgi:hypothetical protein
VADAVGTLAKHFAKQKLTAGQFVVQSGCLSFGLGQHGISADISAIVSLSIRAYPAFAGATRAANIVAVTNSPKIKTCVRSRNFMTSFLPWRRTSQKSEDCDFLPEADSNRSFVIVRLTRFSPSAEPPLEADSVMASI